MSEPLALVVEDDEDINEIFCQALIAAGFSPHTVRDGKSAIDFLNTVVPKVVILDLHLPNLSGETILNTIRGDTRLGKVRVVVTTADAALGEFMREAADFVMIKPISYVQLRELCRRLNSKTE